MKQFSTAFIILAILSAMLLTGQALGFKAFGGNGFVNYLTLRIDETNYPRGSTYEFKETKAISPLLYYSSDISCTIWGEKGTNIEFTDTRPNHFTIRLTTGRVTTDCKMMVLVNKTSLQIQGEAEIIHYSWKGLMEITPKQGYVNINNTMTISAPYNDTFSTETGIAIRKLM